MSKKIYCMKKRNIHLFNIVVNGNILTKATGVFGALQRFAKVNASDVEPFHPRCSDRHFQRHTCSPTAVMERAQHPGTQEQDNSLTSLWSDFSQITSPFPPSPPATDLRVPNAPWWPTLSLDDGLKNLMCRVETCPS